MAEPRTHGIWAPALTPFDASLAPDGARLTAHVAALLEQGCRGVVLFGSTGEAASLSAAERVDLLDAVLEGGGAGAERLIVGAGACALPDVLELASAALARGCRRLLLLPPFYYKPVSDAGLVEFFGEVLRRLGGEPLLYLYHFPRLSGVPISHQLLGWLREQHGERIVGVKDSSGDGEHLDRLCWHFGNLEIFCGNEKLLLRGLDAGSAGCITASANVQAPALEAVRQAWAAGDTERAATLQDQATAWRDALEAAGPLVPILKRLVAERTGDPRWALVRPPFCAMTDETWHAARPGLVG